MTGDHANVINDRVVGPTLHRTPLVRWFPAEPARRALQQLAASRDLAVSELSRLLGLDRRTLQRLASRRRLRTDAADRIAVALGRHPCELWPTWFDATADDERAV